MPDPVEILLSDLSNEKLTQCRESIDDTVVAEYAELHREGHKFPPIDVVVDAEKGCAYIVDGWHRVAAARREGASSIMANVVAKAGIAEAVDWATASNKSHGLKRTNKDKRIAVHRALEVDAALKRERTDREVAAHVGVHHSLVQDVRAEMGNKPTRSQKKKQQKGGEKSGEPSGGEGGSSEPPPDEARPRIEVDRTGKKITDDRVEVAMRGVPTFESIIRDLKVIGKQIEELAKTEAGAEINKTAIKHDLKAVIGAVKFAMPHAGCPYGQNKACDDSCKTCKGHGWITEAVFDNLPAEMKDEVPAAA